MNLCEVYDTFRLYMSQDDLKLLCKGINIILILQMKILRKEKFPVPNQY